MSYEMTILGLVTLLYIFSWLPAWLAKYRAYGSGWLLSNRSTAGLPALPEQAQRAVRAHENIKENYPPFAVAILLLAFSGGYTQYTALAAMLFLLARLVHLPAYILGIPWLRTSSWIAGFIAMLYLLIMALAVLV
ncbi:MAG TPA: MAPEG family protein [Gammaproteobacteria bacterium]|nr:MAPEG family protein [Gammaproteobacteria bacterium]